MDVGSEAQDAAPPAKKAKLEDDSEESKTLDSKASDAGDTTLAEQCAPRETTTDSEDITDNTTALCEKDAGITEYISCHKGFTGIIKQRYSDFIVNEISEEGEIIHLTCRDLPKEEEVVPEDPPCDVLKDEDTEKINQLTENSDIKACVFIEAECDKETRTRMHKAIKARYPALNSNTVEEGGKKMLRISKINTDRRTRPEWKSGRGNYCRFVLYKENKDTMDAINLVARLAILKTHLFRYAGTKDKRGKTSQEVTAYRVTANKLEAVNARLRNMMLGNFRYVKEPLTLGQLQGNHFTVVLRNVTGTLEQIESAMTSLRDIGFINYYGMQRFGTTSIPTHHVGRELLHGNWEEAVDLILKPRVGEDKSMRACREAWEKSHDPSEVLPLVPGHHSIEKTLLQALVKQGERNFANAIKALPRNTRLMYVHAYQSYVWNTVTSHRVKQFGCKVNIGDLVLPREFKSNRKGDGDTNKVHPTVITAENQSEYSIQDVVLPLPGFDINYPGGEIGKWYRELLEKDDLDIDNMKQKNKDFSLPGDYRHLVVTPKQMTWEVIPYNDYMVPLCHGDLDVMLNKPKPEAVKGGKMRALKLELSLPASCYATMALREVLKTDTSAAFQSTLNVT